MDELNKIYVEPTNRCNLTCVTCIRNSWDEPFGDMDRSVYQALIDGLMEFPGAKTIRVLIKRNMESLTMKMNSSKVMAGVFCLSLLFLFTLPAVLLAAATEVPVKGMVTMVDLGAGACIPCKLMAPILEKVEKEYAGRAAVVFLDVRKDKALVKRFGIRAIPTQLFFDKDGKEVYRHEGFLSEKEIVDRFKDMGVK